MNLVIDIGNTLVKYAVFENRTLIFDQSSESGLFLSKIKELFELYPKIRKAIISSVGTLDRKERDIVAMFCKVHVLSNASKVPFKNSYATPQTLGVDRIALATAAFYQNPRGNTLVIDAGTCITYDMVNNFGEYVGGAISPGVQMRYNAMHNQTAGLPQLKPDDFLDFIGNSTSSCMHSGVINGVAREVDGVIEQYVSRFQDLTVILTGGDSHFFAKRLKNTIFANSKFLLEGLNCLLEYNTN
ncbi:type III pantothenate kinase [Flagellimonas zhangzhouensis]|uniref:Type III pantothenate kinase n=1 Tax=Flagellimonas zhangzhouensis TaxID=1073328 RepID=A0A1H2VNI2_9FLAO|nr:type III pantothenate kinase [Allomuricauda zhangzhouensis]SDQ06649.1 type III pantothenate kinase [Allomuricauda zhangzhouensis]SDW69915.1 type III pantothenate kinase [Allomuricauda zhangzhouensis]